MEDDMIVPESTKDEESGLEQQEVISGKEIDRNVDDLLHDAVKEVLANERTLADKDAEISPKD